MPTRHHHRPPTADRLLVVLCDVEMGCGGPFDDFPHSDWLAEHLLAYNEPPYDDLAVDLVLNGDTFDLLKTPYMGAFPRHVTCDVALAKMATILAAHPRFFEAIRRFVAHEGAPRAVHFVIGNHDAELVFPALQNVIRSVCGRPERIHFPGFELDVGRVHIEHGQQLDAMFRVDPEIPLVPYQGAEVLNISWGGAALLDTLIPLQPLFHFHDRLKPKMRVFELMPEVRELLVGIMWKYWTGGYWEGFFTKDPTRKLTWTLIKELASRFASKEPDVIMAPVFQKRMEHDDTYLLYVLGHLHQPGCWSFGDRKVLQLGCVRNEYMLADEGQTLRPMPKSYGEIYLCGELPVASHLLELEAPPAPPGYLPESIFEVLPKVREMLAPVDQRKDEHQAQKAQEKAEAADEQPART